MKYPATPCTLAASTFHPLAKLSMCLGVTAALLCAVPIASAEVITLESPLTNSWVGNPSTSQVGPYGGYQYAVGNLGNAPQQFQTLLKFDISTLNGVSILDASINLALYFYAYETGTYTAHTVGVTAFETDLGASAFTGASYGQATLSIGTFQVTTAATEGQIFSINVASALQYAVNQGFDYFAIQVNDITADGISTAPYGTEMVSFSSTTLPTLSYTAVPEPSIVGLIGLSVLGACFLLRKKPADRTLA